ncbi:GNAT family N-acetyltransferase [Aestuariispira insulae]|uniref:RimJ/RimL family protein N-acetyltransferase n=1 Tax=Aestuariispira insulae TaxID=1461337 RepID=A0A3D9H475_9PROT|nr:GNAT family N-acetyltransferase [Aestuariispira insulae]RED44288.1 RimJ/RimL family protein N-acetyltransferase [Aestuariispira insulae]
MTEDIQGLTIEGSSIILEEFQEKHLFDPTYFSWLRNPDVVSGINRIEYLMPLQFNKVEEYVRNLFISKNDAFFAIIHKETGVFIGTLRLLGIDWRMRQAEVGIMIGHQDFIGKGLSKKAVSLAARYAFERLSLRRLCASTNETNMAMCRCFKSLGFHQEGVLRQHAMINGKYTDRILFGLFPEEFVPDA